MCKGLREQYPENDTPDAMMNKYFPENVKVSSGAQQCEFGGWLQ